MATTDDAGGNWLPGLLIVEPDSQARDALARGMERHGWRIWAAADDAAAVETCRLHLDRIDAALIDLQLPGLQGVKVLAELNRLNPDIVCCAMSANVTPYTARAFQQLSRTPLFAKPLNVPALSLSLHEMISTAIPARS